MSRVTSVELEEEDVEYIERLMREGRVRSLKEFVEMCVKFGRQYTLDRWQKGLFDIGPVRIVFLPKKALDLLIERVEQEDHRDLGREMGEVIKSFALFQFQTDTTKDWDSALEIMSNFGWGQFSATDRDYIQIVSPALPSSLMKSYVESVLNVKLEPIQMKIDVQVFRILKD
ncbi:hypothetical protein [Candidatus Hecatella orcuttiae]|jgi:hypothetical protein|uniref:hypothetical protein n=1 Tax=Candidatus Hecatella orcuttiae TaxID=1935119 RepID=UPI0028682180|nr:hypothetical protein [Candidatus Hecatella orcuttiae]